MTHHATIYYRRCHHCRQDACLTRPTMACCHLKGANCSIVRAIFTITGIAGPRQRVHTQYPSTSCPKKTSKKKPLLPCTHHSDPCATQDCSSPNPPPPTVAHVHQRASAWECASYAASCNAVVEGKAVQQLRGEATRLGTTLVLIIAPRLEREGEGAGISAACRIKK
jgi:hypothetical protein